MHFAGHDAFGLNLDAALGKNYTIEAPGNHHAVSLDLSLDLCTLAKNHGLLGNDVAFHVAINSEGAADRERSFHGYTLIDEPRPFFAVVRAIVVGGWPLPRHIEFPQIFRQFYFQSGPETSQRTRRTVLSKPRLHERTVCCAGEFSQRFCRVIVSRSRFRCAAMLSSSSAYFIRRS